MFSSRFRAPRERIGGGAASRVPLVACMVLAVAALAGLSYWDDERESQAALDDFAREQRTLATSVGAELTTRLALGRRDALSLAMGNSVEESEALARAEGYSGFSIREKGTPAPQRQMGAIALHVPAPDDRTVDLMIAPAKLLEGMASLEEGGAARVLMLAPGSEEFRASDGHVVENEVLMKGLRSGNSSAWLSREEALALGLSKRRAAVGFAQVDGGALGHWGVAVVSSAERERDREVRARTRLALSVLSAAAIVLGFGAVALRKQRRELLLERELALSDVRRERDARLAAANRAATMGTLAMGIAHEVSTPLGVIVGRVEQLGPRVVSDERSARAVQAIGDEAERIRKVVRGFLDLARGDTPSLGETSPSAVLTEAVTLVEHRFATAQVSLNVEVDPEVPSIHCDPQMLGQAIVNLLLNACDASPTGSAVTARVRCEKERVAFEVRDEGVGIAPEAAAKATEPFFTTKPRGQGTGLGLAIASEIVKLHHGELSLSAGTPRGTTASIVLPTRGTVRDAA